MRDTRTTIKAIINAKVRANQGQIDKFKEEMNRTDNEAASLNYALHWHGESTLEATRFMLEVRPFVQLIEKKDFSLKDLKSFCKNMRKDIMFFFKNAGFRANSTSAISNLENIALGKAYGALLDMVEQIEMELEDNIGEDS